jgi:hypothetical protein
MCYLHTAQSSASISIILAYYLEGVSFKVKSTIGAIAQLGERLPCTQEVCGSIPHSSTIFLKRKCGDMTDARG